MPLAMLPTFENDFQRWFWTVVLIVAGLLLMFLGYKLGKLLGVGSQRKVMHQKEEELFSAQRGFKQVYDQELDNLKKENATLKEDKQNLMQRVEEYRRKAAGYGGLFNSGGKKEDAMYALLLENEALEEALFTQNDKLRMERTDAVKEQLRAASYRRVLMSQLMEDGKITNTARQIVGNEQPEQNKLPGGTGQVNEDER
jgi:hypothetical protein